MEPNDAVGSLSDVQSQPAAQPATHSPVMPSPLRPQAVMQVVVAEAPPSFHDFYVASRDRVGRALAVTLRDNDLAADAVDEAMARAYQRWDVVCRMDNPSGWVYRVGLNVARSRLRRLIRRRADAASAPRAATAAEPTITDPAIARALAELSVDHRAVVVCRLLLGWSEAETAVALQIRPGTAKSRLHRALATLEPKLAHLRPEGHT
jgi:RNA polymerase sigma factor (sigma-70 family)